MLTAKQQQTYQFICDYMQCHEYAPTEAEIAEGIGIKSRGVAHRYVKALAAAGWLEIVPQRQRNIRLTQTSPRRKGTLPIIGKIAAGEPLEALEQNRVLDISHHLLGANRFVLEVKGDSMQGDNICDGDYIICEHRNEINKSDIVVALIDNKEATLKRIQYNQDETITLLASNPNYAPMTYQAQRVTLQGVYLGLLRLNEK